MEIQQELKGIPDMVLTNDPSKLDRRFEWAEVTCMDDFPLQRFVPTRLVPPPPTSPDPAFDDYEW